jgi:futalosine hydrolase
MPGARVPVLFVPDSRELARSLQTHAKQEMTVALDRWLIAVAAPAEARAVLAGFDLDPAHALPDWQPMALDARFDLVRTGIGKANAAAAVARALAPAHRGIVSLGVAGSLPGSGLALRQVVVADRCVYADEGVETPDSFLTCAAIGFPLAPPPATPEGVPLARSLRGALAPLLAGGAAAIGGIATVSTCSGTDARARAVAERTGAIAEAMEGAAIAHVAVRLGVLAAEIRVISNTTGDRAAQVWDLRGSLDRLAALARELRRLELSLV